MQVKLCMPCYFPIILFLIKEGIEILYLRLYLG